MKYVYIVLLTIPMNIECMLIRAARIPSCRMKILKKQSRFQPVRFYNAGHPLNDPKDLQNQIDTMSGRLLSLENRLKIVETDQDILFDALKKIIIANNLVTHSSFIEDHNMHYGNQTHPEKE